MALLAITSGKGGVGKTTCAVNLCAAMRELGHDPILLDADSGGDATWLLGFRSADQKFTVDQ
jgi:chromosome partitioning protein